MTAHDVFSTETAGLPDVARPQVHRLADGDLYSLSIGPVRKTLHGDPDAELRMLAYRTATFWLPAPLGWVAFVGLQRRGRI